MEEQKSSRRRPMIVAAVVGAVIIASGAGAWGYTAYRDAKVTQAAEDLYDEVRTAHSAAADAASEYGTTLESATASLEILGSSSTLVGDNGDFFAEESREAFRASVQQISALIDESSAAELDPFDETLDSFVERYREADGAGRELIAEDAQTQVAAMEDQAGLFHESANALTTATAASTDALLTVVGGLEADVEAVVEKHPEAAEDTAKSLRATVESATGWAEVEEAEVAERLGDLHTLLEAHVGAAAALQASHTKAVAEREAAERRAANQRAGNSGGSNRGTRLCNRFRWGPNGSYLSLEIC